jgi:hypothetical protein
MGKGGGGCAAGRVAVGHSFQSQQCCQLLHMCCCCCTYLQSRACSEVGQVPGCDLNSLAPPCCCEAVGQVQVGQAGEVGQVGQQTMGGFSACVDDSIATPRTTQHSTPGRKGWFS